MYKNAAHVKISSLPFMGNLIGVMFVQ